MPNLEPVLRDLRMARWDLEAASCSASQLGADNIAACLDAMRGSILRMMEGLEKCGSHLSTEVHPNKASQLMLPTAPKT